MVKSAVRWGLRHGLAQVAIRKGAKHGDAHGRLVTGGSEIDPHPIYDEMRAKGPVVMGAFAMVTARHGVISEILRSDDFAAGLLPWDALPRPLAKAGLWAQDPRNPGPVEPPSLLVINGVDHLRLRKLVSRAFTARAVDALGRDVENVADQLLDRLAREHPGGGRADLVHGYAHALPVQIIARILGVPLSMQDTFLRWGDDLAASLDIGLPYREYRRSEKALAALNDWLRQHCAELRRNPGDDLLSRVVLAGEADGTALTEQELTSLAGLVLAAGFETTVNLIGNGTVLLFDHPEQREILRRDPSLWRNAVEEVLRFDSPVQNTARHAVRDTTVQGVRIRRHVLVALMLAGANRDPEVFRDPHIFDVTRSNAKEHLAFSAGPHYCLGAALARLEGEIGLRMLFDRFPDLAADGPARRRPTRLLRGWSSIPARLGSSVTAAA